MNEKWVRDTGIIFSLIFLYFGYKGTAWAFAATSFILVALLFFPKVLWPLGYAWLKLAELLQKIVSKIFFGLVFFAIITPIGYMLRFIKGDARDLVPHPERASAFVDRNGWTTADKIERPY